jgi:nucleoside-diphosphate-sugar epimerase
MPRVSSDPTRPSASSLAGAPLVVFGAGYVGGALVAEALKLGMCVTALTRNAERAQNLRALGAQVVVQDLASRDWHDAIPRQDFVVNCVSSGGGGTEAYRRSYVLGTQSIVEWMRARAGCHTLVYTSSTSVYPQKQGVVDEDSPTAGATGTAEVLLEAEQLVRKAEVDGVCARAFILRLAGIYGPDRHHLLDQLRAGTSLLPGKGEHKLNLIHRDDIIAAILAVLQSDVPGQVFNVADDGPASKQEVVAWIADQIHAPFHGFTGEPVPGRRVDVPDRVVSNARIKRALGWAPRFADFRAGYRSLLGA